jgi:hypothetical protein
VLLLVLASALAAPAPSNFEVTVTEEALTELLASLAPITRTVQQGPLTLHVRFTDPVVKVTPKAIGVTMKYRATDSGGLIDVSGVATPEMVLRAVRAKRIFEGRLVRSGITLPGGIELPVDGLVDPIVLPAIVTQPISLGEARADATAQGTDVVLEKGKVRISGVVSFAKAK